jgi:starvation-inducible DNA-binding protein
VLADDLKVLLASCYGFAIKVQQFHWCVEGPDFPQYHKFFGEIYDDIQENAIDQTAEYVRILGSYTPGSFTRLAELCIIEDQLKIPRAQLMIAELHHDNLQLINLLNQCFAGAEQENKQGIMDFLASRLDSHEKWSWQLNSTLKSDRA